MPTGFLAVTGGPVGTGGDDGRLELRLDAMGILVSLGSTGRCALLKSLSGECASRCDAGRGIKDGVDEAVGLDAVASSFAMRSFNVSPPTACWSIGLGGDVCKAKEASNVALRASIRFTSENPLLDLGLFISVLRVTTGLDSIVSPCTKKMRLAA